MQNVDPPIKMFNNLELANSEIRNIYEGQGGATAVVWRQRSHERYCGNDNPNKCQGNAGVDESPAIHDDF
jgi:hypothetical protein